MSKAGNFTIAVWADSGMMCIEYRDKEIARMRLSELPDLRYAVQRAQQEAVLKNPKLVKEVYVK